MNSYASKLMVLVCLATLFLSSGVQAECTNYEDYLHWVTTSIFDGAPSGVVVQDGYQYVIEDNFGVRVFDVSNESNPVLVGTLGLPYTFQGMNISGNTLTIIDSTVLFLVDISDPSSPILCSETPAATTMGSVGCVGDFAYIASRNPDQLNIVEISDPFNPIVKSPIGTAYGHLNLAVAGENIYLATYDGLQVINISNPDSPSILATWVKPNYSIVDVAIEGNYAYVTATGNVTRPFLCRINISNPSYPTGAGEILTDVTFGYAPLLTVAANVAYIGYSTYGQCMRYEFTGGAFHKRDNLVGINGNLSDLTVWGANLYGLTYSTIGRLHTVSVQSPSPMEPISSISTPGDAQSIVLGTDSKANLAYIADGDAGMQIVDITDPLNPVLLGSVNTPGSAVDIVLSGDIAFVADSGSGLQIIDVSNSSSPTIIGDYDTPGSTVKLDISADVAFLADTDFGLQIVDIANLNAPSLLFNLTITGNAVDVTLGGSYAYVAAEDEGVVICEVSDPENPWIIGGVKGKNGITARNVDFARGLVYATDHSAGMYIIDVADTNNISVLGDVGVIATGLDIRVQGIFSYVSSSGGVNIVDVRDPESPAIVGSLAIPSTSRSTYINEFYAFVVNGTGLQICPSQCGFDETAEAYFTPSTSDVFCPAEILFTNESVGYGLTYQWDFGDGVGSSTDLDPSYTFSEPGDYLVTLTVTNGVNVGYYSQVISAVVEEPTITTVTDIPDDQGGFVYVEFYRSGYDNDGLNRSEMYTIERLDGMIWSAVATTGAYNRPYYSAILVTQGDGSESWTTQFRVIAHMDEGNWVSTSSSGFSIDNIAPQVPQNVIWLTGGVLTWDQIPDSDFAYYQIFGSATDAFDESEPIGATIENSFTPAVTDYNWFFITAVDNYGNHSDPTSPALVSGVPDVLTAVSLSAAVPNPFNPLTRIEFGLPKAAHATLAVYDISGHLVKTLVNEVFDSGVHSVVWRGQDDANRRVSAGTYFYRLETEGIVVTKRMMLIK